MLTTFEDMYETHEQCTQLLAVEGVLLLCNVHFDFSGGNIIQQHSYQLQQEPGGRWNMTLQVTKRTNSEMCRTKKKIHHSNLISETFKLNGTVKTLTNRAKVSSGWAFCASPLVSGLPSVSAAGGSLGKGLC